MGAFDDLIPTDAKTGKLSAAREKQNIALSAKLQGALGVERQLKRIRELYDKSFKGVGPGSIMEYLPTQGRKQFDGAANGMRPLLKPLIRGPGEGAFTDSDQLLLDQMIPNGSMQDAENEERFSNIEGLIGDARRQGGAGKSVTPTIRRVR